MHLSTIPQPEVSRVIDRALVRRLQQQSCNPSVSVLLTTTPGSEIVTRDVIRLYRLLDEAHHQLRREPGVTEGQSQHIVGLLRRLAVVARRGPAARGLALLVSDVHAEAIHLPGCVEDRVVIDPTFATRDLVRALEVNPRYRLLVLAQRGARLFEGQPDLLEEIVADGFPVACLTPDPRKDRSTRFGRDRSDRRDAAIHAQLRSVDAALAARNASEPLPLLVSGVRRQLALFRATTTQAHTMVGQILGSHGRATPIQLAQMAKPEIQRHQRSRTDRAMSRLHKEGDRRRLANGIDRVWAAAADGRVALLCVEEGYVVPARVGVDGRHLHPIPYATPGSLDDAIDELVEMVSLVGGEVVLVEDGTLSAERRVAALLSCQRAHKSVDSDVLS
jgi:hypothetical protein